MEKERNLNYWTIRKFSLLYSYGDKQVHFWMNEEIVTFF